MKKIALTSFVTSLYVVLPGFVSQAFAGGGGGDGHAPGLGTLFWPTVNFILYAALIRFMYKKLGKPALVSHSVQVRNDLEEAAKSFADAESELAKAQAMQGRLPEEKTSVVERLREEGKNIAKQTLEEGNKQAALIQSDAVRRIAGDTAKVKAELRETLVREASKIAREQLKSELSAEQDIGLRKAAIMSVLN